MVRVVGMAHVGIRIEGISKRFTHVSFAVRGCVDQRDMLEVMVLMTVRVIRLIAGCAGCRAMSEVRMFHGGRPPSSGHKQIVGRSAVRCSDIPFGGISYSILPPKGI
jgi:hypothetical protein